MLLEVDAVDFLLDLAATEGGVRGFAGPSGAG